MRTCSAACGTTSASVIFVRENGSSGRVLCCPDAGPPQHSPGTPAAAAADDASPANRRHGTPHARHRDDARAAGAGTACRMRRMVVRSTVCPETGNVTGSRISSCGADLVKIGQIEGAVKPGERSKWRGGGGGRRWRLRERVQELLWDLRRAVAWAAAACRDTPAIAGFASGRIPGPPRYATRPRRRTRRGAGGEGRSQHRARAPRALLRPPPRGPARPTPRGAPRAEKGFAAQSEG